MKYSFRPQGVCAREMQVDMTKVQLADTTGRLNVTFFNNRFAAEQLQYGREYIFYGAVSGDFAGYNMTNPVFEATDAPGITTRRVLPVYPLTAGLSNSALLKLIAQALAVCDPPAEILPEPVRHSGDSVPPVCLGLRKRHRSLLQQGRPSGHKDHAQGV